MQNLIVLSSSKVSFNYELTLCLCCTYVVVCVIFSQLAASMSGLPSYVSPAARGKRGVDQAYLLSHAAVVITSLRRNSAPSPSSSSATSSSSSASCTTSTTGTSTVPAVTATKGGQTVVTKAEAKRRRKNTRERLKREKEKVRRTFRFHHYTFFFLMQILYPGYHVHYYDMLFICLKGWLRLSC